MDLRVCSMSKCCQNCFPKFVNVYFFAHAAVHKSSHCFISTQFLFSTFLILATLLGVLRYLIVVLTHISLVTNETECFSVIDHLDIRFYEGPIWVSCPFLGLSVFFWMSFRSSLFPVLLVLRLWTASRSPVSGTYWSPRPCFWFSRYGTQESAFLTSSQVMLLLAA